MGSQEETALPSLSVLAVIMLLSQCKLLAFPVMLDEKVLCNSVFPILGDDA